MPAGSFQINDELNAVFAFINLITDGLDDPITVTVKYKIPDGTITSYVYNTDAQVTKLGQGVYRFRKIIAASGRHHVRVEGAGNVNGAIEGYFDVDESVF